MEKLFFIILLYSCSLSCLAQDIPQGVPVPNNTYRYNSSEAKKEIDSLYNILILGANFELLAKEYSQDPGSFSDGGKCKWNNPQYYVTEVQDQIKILKDGQLSKPFKTVFGYHIMKVLERKKDEIHISHILLMTFDD